MAKLSTVFRNLFRKPAVDSDLDAELRAFVEMKTDENISRGMSPRDARRAALVECGGVEQVKESVREIRAGALLEQFAQDVRFGARMLRKSPGFTAVAVLTIALGIGVNASIFEIFNSAALRPLQLPSANRVVSIYEDPHGKITRLVRGGPNLFSYPEFREYQDRNQVFTGLAAYLAELRASLDDGQDVVSGQLTSCNYFDVVGVKPAIGRGFLASECAAKDSGPVVVISDRLWRDRYRADPAIVGKTIRLNHAPLTVVGIAAPDFHGTHLIPAAFWAPVTNHATVLRAEKMDMINDEQVSAYSLVGRLKDGVSLAQARANLQVIASDIDRRTPDRKTTLTVDVATLFDRPDMHMVVLAVGAVVLTAVGLVLLIACANLANLMLARATARTHEVSIRLAVGASRSRLVRQLLTESLLIAFVGGTLGLLASVWSEQVLVQWMISRIPDAAGQAPILNLAPDHRLFLYALGLTLITGLAFGLAPALQASRADLNGAMKQDAAIPEPRRNWMRSALMAAQVAGCMVLLVTAGLLLRGLYHAQTIDPGYDMTHQAVITFDLQREGYTKAEAENFLQNMSDRLHTVPGVTDVVPMFSSPLADMHAGGMYGPSGHPQHRVVSLNIVGYNFFQSVGIPLVRGRAFTESEIHNGADVLIVNETLARTFWPGEDPIGKQIHGGAFHPEKDMEVIGVAKDVQVDQLGEAHKPFIYEPATPDSTLEIRTVLVQTTGASRDSLELIRTAAHSVDKAAKVDVATLESNIESWIAPSRIVVVLSATLGALGLILASIGIYGTVSYSVARRVREIGIRMTLGARAGDVLSTILRRAMRPVAIGAAVGLVLCLGVSQILRVVLFGVSPLDPIAYISVAAFLFVVALLASYLPARRALRVDPMTAIRHE